MKYTSLALLLSLPMVTFADNGLFDYIPSVLKFISDVIIPFFLGIAFLVVVVNIVRYFILEINGAGDKKTGVASGREKAKAYLLYSIMAFVFILVFWGIINLLTAGTGLEGGAIPPSDYVELDPT